MVIDGAAMFDVGCKPPGYFFGTIPVALSLHATKGYGTGEGGAVVCTEPGYSSRRTQVLNFGFCEGRNSSTPSTNGKISEYHAAVGLAGLDEWSEKRMSFLAVAGRYRKAMAGVGLSDRFIGAPDVGFCYSLFQCLNAAEAARLKDELQLGRVGWRLWYGSGLHHQSYFSSHRRDRLDVTDEMAPLLFGLPMAVD